MSPRLSGRLQAVADLVLRGQPAADIGCDHAQLAAALVRSGAVPHAIASDVRPGPLKHARTRLAKLTAVEVRLGSGLSTLRPDEVATVAVAGMGGALMLELLEASPEILATTQRVILQPNTGWESVRRALAQRKIPLDAEVLTQDAGRLYLTMAFDPRARSGTWDEADIMLGPRLRRDRPTLFGRWVAHRREHLSRLRERLSTELGATHRRVTALEAEQEHLETALSLPVTR
ncbi:MAG: class I SAM-dependent methyltransferase [Nannocystaceae bacterium]|nr:class I SAM-dependent methyltransferase [Nannocystaceae bacterium]